MAAAPTFAPFMDSVKVKCHMSKVVIEFLQNNLDATYEDLLNKLQVCNILCFAVNDDLFIY